MSSRIERLGEGAARLLDLHPPAGSLRADVHRGLSARPRTLPPKYFYDDAGALLFERITQLPEYYPTRIETAILRRHGAAMAQQLGPFVRLVEFGSGSGDKTRIMLEQLEAPTSYVPIDISRRQLLQFADSVATEFPDMEVLPVCADYARSVRLPRQARVPRRTVAFFPGSTIGNFETPQAVSFLQLVGRLCGPGGGLLIGTDLDKDRAVLERAYNDGEGVTAAFNLNLLTRINRECGADFELSGFRHHAYYDDARSRIEMRLVATRQQTVTLPVGPAPLAAPPFLAAGAPTDHPPARFEFEPGDFITTEYSHKYRPAAFQALAARAGWRVQRMWQDEERWFAVWLLLRT